MRGVRQLPRRLATASCPRTIRRSRACSSRAAPREPAPLLRRRFHGERRERQCTASNHCRSLLVCRWAGDQLHSDRQQRADQLLPVPGQRVEDGCAIVHGLPGCTEPLTADPAGNYTEIDISPNAALWCDDICIFKLQRRLCSFFVAGWSTGAADCCDTLCTAGRARSGTQASWPRTENRRLRSAATAPGSDGQPVAWPAGNVSDVLT